MTKSRFFLTVLIFCFCASALHAQTCCTGGIPLTGAINLNPREQGLNLGLSYDLNRLSDFIQNDEVLDNTFLERKTKSVILQADYAFKGKFGLTVLVPYSYLSENNSLANTTSKANGFGDISFWGNYRLLEKRNAIWSVAVGVKLPTGETNIKNEGGLFDLPASLQPGTGSVDFMLATIYKSSFAFRPALSYYSTIIYKLNTVGKQYSAHREYRYSNEFDFYLGLTEQVLLANQLITPQVQIRINHFAEHDLGGNLNPNTGGTWMHLGAGFAWAIGPDFSLNVLGQWPFYRSVNGFQLTTTDRYTLSGFFSL